MLPLESERLVLRRFAADDAAALAEYRSDPEVARYQSWESFSAEEAASLIQSTCETPTPGIWFQIAFELRDSGALVGDCGLKIHESDPRQATLGVTMARKYQGRGLAREGLSRLVDHLFEKMDLHRIAADTDPENVRSWRLLERLGMRREGHRRQSLWFKGRWADDYLYAIRREEWRNRPRNTVRV